MNDLERIVKNGVNAAKRVERDWNDKGYNSDIQTRLIIYENGYFVSKYHNAASPQNINVIEKKYKKDLGKLLIDHKFVFDIYNVKTKDIVEDVIDKIQIMN